jgi:hypothetical protein
LVDNLSKQVYFYSVDTSAFYDDEEEKIHIKLMSVYTHINKLNKLKSDAINKCKKDKKLIEQTEKKYEPFTTSFNQRKNKYKELLTTQFEKHDGIRNIRKELLDNKQTISVFDSILTRTLKLKQNQLSDDVIIVRSYYYRILKDIVINGFTKDNEKYVYFTSSAGQIRTKKCVFIKESIWNKYKDSLTCGLSMEEINKKGGVNTNKYQAYMALTNSASVEWKNFDIDKCIVVDGLETNVHCKVDFIDRDTYEITRKMDDVPIEHTDGCGMILPSLSKKCFMVRIPFVKGLLVPFNFREFCKTEKGKTTITDIYGKEWDIEKDDVQIIFTKSQFKMWKYYDGWQDYKDRYKKYHCQAAKMNIEDISGHARLNYQMLQTLNEMTDDELSELAQSTIDDIVKIGSDRKTMLRILGATKYNPNKNDFQKALLIYPELLSDTYSRMAIKNKKKKLIKEAKAGKLNINGKYTFIIPDLYAFCEFLFKDEKNPEGLLSKDEIYCDLYNQGDVDILRSPHLYREHAVRNNIYNGNKSKWFITHGIYTSVFDPISKILMFDNDGDKVIVAQDETLISVAKRHMKDIVPLYYEMAKAKPSELSQEQIYESLCLAYKENIGAISNKITKIWNRTTGVSDDELKAMKWLVMENNFVIDFAKTMFKTKRPSEINKKLLAYDKGNLPYFFMFAKDKERKRVNKPNNSIMNKLRKLIPKDKRITYENIVDVIDYHNLMQNKTTPLDNEVIDYFNSLNRNKKFRQQDAEELEKRDELYVFQDMREEILNNFSDYPINKIVDILVRYMYEKNKRYKTSLWGIFGDIIYANLEENLKGTIACDECGKRIKSSSQNNSKYCDDCAKNKEKERKRKWKRKNYIKKSSES